MTPNSLALCIISQQHFDTSDIAFCLQEENDDGELRRASMRRRTLSTASRRISIVSHTSMSRPLTTSSVGQPTRQTSQSSHDRTPPSSPMSVSTFHCCYDNCDFMSQTRFKNDKVFQKTEPSATRIDYVFSKNRETYST